MITKLPNIYLITDRHQINQENDYFDVIDELLSAGVRMVQLREKDLPASELYDYAIKLREITRKYNSLLLINDRVDIAQAVSADGVHLGKASIPATAARKLLGDHKLIGVSTHGLKEAQTAQHDGADFITFGPVYETPSKVQYGQPVGTEALQAVSKLVTVPIYALGGIKTEKIVEVTKCGADGIAAISALISPPHPAQSFRKIRDQLK